LRPATISYDAVTGKGAKRISFAQVDVARAAEYAAEDADVTLRVHQVLRPQIAAAPELESALPRPRTAGRRSAVPHGAQRRADRRGDLLAQQSDELGRKIMAIEAEAQQLAGQPFNLNSPKQLAEILFNQQGLPVVKKTPSGGSLDRRGSAGEAGRGLPAAEADPRTPQPRQAEEHLHRQAAEDGQPGHRPRAHQLRPGHRGHRPAGLDRPQPAEHPDPHAEGRRIRSAFIAPENRRIVSADYSQIELRIMAHLSDDPRLLEAFAAGEDVHRATAGEVFGVTPIEVSSEQRRYAKVINFGLIYGMSAFGLAKQTSASTARRRRPTSTATSRATPASPLHGRAPAPGARQGLRRDRVRPPPVAARHPRQPMPAAARAPSAPRSTRRCRARPPT
jgi:DNA polymerase-1